MINSYEIEKYNNEEVLYIYFDLNNEFAKINFKEQKQKLEKVIQDFIRENKIIFTGTTVALVVGSTVVGNVILNNDKKTISNQNEVSIIDNINAIPVEEEIELKDFVEEDINEEENITTSENKIESKKVDNIVVRTSTPSQTSAVQNTNYKSNSNIQKSEEKSETTTQELENKVEEKETQEPQEYKTYIKVKRKNGEVINIELEEYIIGVVSAEMPAAFQEQALMSQAIIARTYALKANSKGQVLTDTESTQSYKSNDELKNIWGNSYDTYYNKIKNAVLNTEGMYLTYNGTYIEAVYHSTSNGYTEDSSNVWGNSFPYLVSVSSEYDSLNPSFLQQTTITYEELSSKLGSEITKDTDFNIINKTTGNRVGNIEVNGKIYTGVDFRNILGLRSADFDITKTLDYVIFTTRGYGHGVGLSQYGANGMAKNGYSYIEILKHYYPGVSISYL